MNLNYDGLLLFFVVGVAKNNNYQIFPNNTAINFSLKKER